MVIELKPDQQRVIDLAMQSDSYQDPNEVIATALSDVEDGAMSEARRDEPRSTLAEVEAELRAIGKLK